MSGGVFSDYLDVARVRLASGTFARYDRDLKRFLVFLAQRHPSRRRLTLELLNADAIESWFGLLVDDQGEAKLSIPTATNCVTAVYAAWKWAYDSDAYSEIIGRPRMIHLPRAPGAPTRAPSWDEMDRAIAAAYRLADEAPAHRTQSREAWAWRARLCVVLRFTGLRVEQAMGLRWDDVDLGRAELTVRGELGKSHRERSGRIVPISPLLVAELEGWGERTGWLVRPLSERRFSDQRLMRRPWEQARPVVPVRVWGKAAGRLETQVHHAFRKGFKTGISRFADRDVRDFLVGHHRGLDEIYIETFDRAREAVAQIPALNLTQEDSVQDNVKPMDPAKAQS